MDKDEKQEEEEFDYNGGLQDKSEVIIDPVENLLDSIQSSLKQSVEIQQADSRYTGVAKPGAEQIIQEYMDTETDHCHTGMSPQEAMNNDKHTEESQKNNEIHSIPGLGTESPNDNANITPFDKNVTENGFRPLSSNVELITENHFKFSGIAAPLKKSPLPHQISLGGAPGLSNHNHIEHTNINHSEYPDTQSPGISSDYIPATLLNTHHKGSCIIATFSPDGLSLASGSKDASIKIVSVEGLNSDTSSLFSKPVTRTFQHNSGQINDLRFHPSGTVLASASDHGSVKFFDATKSNFRKSFKSVRIGTSVKSLSFHPSGDYFLVGLSSQKLLLYDTHTLKAFSSNENYFFTSYPCVRFSPNASYFATVDGSSDLHIWDVVSSKKVCTIAIKSVPTFPNAPIYPSVKLADLAWNSTSTQIAVCNYDASISTYDIRAKKLLHTYRKGLAKEINPSVSYSKGDKYLFAIDESLKKVIVWNTLTQKVHANIPAHSRPIMCVVGNPNSYSFASCSEDFKTKYWAPIEQ